MSTDNTRIEQLEKALQAMWSFASSMVEKHGTTGDNTLTDGDHQVWQDAAGEANSLLKGCVPLGDPWHLFFVEATGGDETTGDLVKGFVISGQSGSELKAEELVRAALEDDLPEGWHVTHSRKLGMCDGDIYEQVSGELAAA